MINWRVRLRNKTFLVTFIPKVIAFAYVILGLAGVLPSLTKDTSVDVALAAIDLLAMLGIVSDPTTTGISDSNQALNYDKPRGDM